MIITKPNRNGKWQNANKMSSKEYSLGRLSMELYKMNAIPIGM